MRRIASRLRAYSVSAMIALCLLVTIIDHSRAGDAPTGLVAEGHDSRIDLVWNRVSNTDLDLFNIYRSEQADGPWKKLNARPHTIHVYSDFIGVNGRTYHYRVTHLSGDNLDTPTESMATLKYFYYKMGARLWGPFGFRDAFNLDAHWVSPSYLAIDQGPMAPMIENYRTGLPWKMFMKSDVAQKIREKLTEARPAARQP